MKSRLAASEPGAKKRSSIARSSHQPWTPGLTVGRRRRERKVRACRSSPAVKGSSRSSAGGWRAGRGGGRRPAWAPPSCREERAGRPRRRGRRPRSCGGRSRDCAARRCGCGTRSAWARRTCALSGGSESSRRHPVAVEYEGVRREARKGWNPEAAEVGIEEVLDAPVGGR